MRNKISKQSLLRLAVILFLFGMLSWPAGSRPGARAQATAWPALIFSPVVTNLHMPVHVTHAGDVFGFDAPDSPRCTA